MRKGTRDSAVGVDVRLCASKVIDQAAKRIWIVQTCPSPTEWQQNVLARIIIKGYRIHSGEQDIRAMGR